MNDYTDALSQIVEMAVEGWHSAEIRHLVDDLPESLEDSAEVFCKRLSLGNWLQESLIENDVDIAATLSYAADKLSEEEATEDIEARFIESSRRQSQGWIN